MSLLMTLIHNLNVLPMKSWSWHCGMFMKSNWCIHPRKETIALMDYLPSIVCRDWDFVGPPNKSIVSLPDASFQTWIEEFQVLSTLLLMTCIGFGSGSGSGFRSMIETWSGSYSCAIVKGLTCNFFSIALVIELFVVVVLMFVLVQETHCSKSSFFVQKFNFHFPRKLSIFLGEKLVKMWWFWTF